MGTGTEVIVAWGQGRRSSSRVGTGTEVIVGAGNEDFSASDLLASVPGCREIAEPVADPDPLAYADNAYVLHFGT